MLSTASVTDAAVFFPEGDFNGRERAEIAKSSGDGREVGRVLIFEGAAREEIVARLVAEDARARVVAIE